MIRTKCNRHFVTLQTETGVNRGNHRLLGLKAAVRGFEGTSGVGSIAPTLLDVLTRPATCFSVKRVV